MAYAWLTDIHLEFLRDKDVVKFVKGLAAQKFEGLFLTGDISTAPRLEFHLQVFEECQCPVYFVLGNHDFYGGSIAKVKERVEELGARSNWLHWLPAKGVIALSEDACLLGHDGWADGRFGDYGSSRILLNDYVKIEEFRQAGSTGRLALLNSLGDQAADHFKATLPKALAGYRHVIVLTHAPPFREACWHDGEISADDWLPHFSCKSIGDVLQGFMSGHPNRQMTVLCGHTHSSGLTKVLPNLLVKTGGAKYGAPDVQEIIE